jgi:hypothetical protein
MEHFKIHALIIHQLLFSHILPKYVNYSKYPQ